MGLFGNKMSHDEAFAVLLSDSASDRDYKKAHEAAKNMTTKDRMLMPLLALVYLRGALKLGNKCSAALDMLQSSEQQDGLGKELMAVYESKFVFKSFSDAFEYSGLLAGALYCARAYENGWGTEKNHEKAVELAKVLANNFEDKKYGDEAKKVYDEIMKSQQDAPISAPALTDADEYEIKDTVFGKVKVKKNTAASSVSPVDNADAQTVEKMFSAFFTPQSEHKRIEMSSGDVYEGETKDGKYHGRGKYTSHKGWVYEGEFTEGEMTGYGKIVFASGRIDEGYFKGGKRNGHFKQIFPGGRIFEGDFVDDRQGDSGRITFESGDIYDGEFSGAKMNGHGIYKELTRDKNMYYCYEGEWVDGKKEGQFKFFIEYIENGHIHPREDKWYRDGEEVEPASGSVNINDIPDWKNVKSGAWQSSTKTYPVIDDLEFIYNMKSSGKICSLSNEEQMQYQYALLRCKGDSDGEALAFVRQCVNTDDLNTLSYEDAEFCVYLLNEIIPRENTRTELSICLYRTGDIDKAARFTPGGTPFGDEIMAWRYLKKVHSDMRYTNKKYALDRMAYVEGHLSKAQKSGKNYRISEIEEEANRLRKLLYR